MVENPPRNTLLSSSGSPDSNLCFVCNEYKLSTFLLLSVNVEYLSHPYTSNFSSSSSSLVVQSCPTLCEPHELQHARPPYHQLSESTQIHVHWVGDAIQPSHPLSSPSPPAFNLLQHQGLFKWVSSSHQSPKYWSFSFNISPSNEHPGLISFRMDWLDLLAVQGTLKSLL